MVIAGKAIVRGGRLRSTSTVAWDAAPRCENPQRVTVEGRARATRGRYVTVVAGTKTQPMWVDIDTPCRRCGPCLETRRLEWTRRAVDETRLAVRTWFCTLTLSPTQQARHLMLSRVHLRGYDDRTDDARFSARCQSIGVEVTRWLKRVRKGSGARIRYLIVYEKHKSGEPHLHALLHQVGAVPVEWQTLHEQWTLGFTSFRLVNDTWDATYLCKYLAKEVAARVRASRFYGGA